MIREEGRVGRFRISRIVFEDMTDENLLRLMGNFIITRAEHMYAGDWIEYTAYSPLFGAVDRGDEIPFYTLELDGSTVKVHR